MTGLLKDTLTERAAALDEPPLDLDAIIATGNRRIRRRRATAVAAVACVSALVLACGVITAKNLAGADEPPVGGVPTFEDRRPTYATGDTIHFGADVIKVGPAKIVSFVQTDAGFAYAAANGDVYFTDGHDDTKIGKGNKRLELTAGDHGTVVGWVDATHAVRQFVLYDVAAGKELARTTVGNTAGKPANDDREPRVIAIDNDQAYLAALDGLHRWNLGTGKAELVQAGLRQNFVVDAANGLLAYDALEGNGGGTSGIAVGPKLGSRKAITDASEGDLSPDGSYLFSDGTDEAHVSRTDGTGEVKLTSGYALLALSVWQDDDHFTTIGIKHLKNPEKTPLDLLTCSVSHATCTVSIAKFARYPADNGIPAFQFPTGKALSD
ncbi:hypothetical protein EV138_6510 [Kribbella voronezhensis]|uniref:Uncharacterized protein n=1 Tax=Kribbella voronezhensis TaxID=2512212 RepID=A0A4R7SXN3_9ACTN|nr:hypothetical protein [Kribbella voronezhensis]TDU84041.1 hypothetical protein EV138_6510 [Kribbella voronezhensis]